MKIVFIRHGEPDKTGVDNRGFIGQGRDMAPLTELGIKQAEDVSLNPLLEGCQVILSSPYTRALQTAAIISKNTGLDIKVEIDIHEFIPDKAFQVKSEVENSANELSHILACFEAESLSDIQPQDVGEDSMPPDPAIYDTLNFIVRDLEAEGELHCPCGKGPYDLRFTDDGMQVYCDSCGATYEFHAKSVSVAEEYIPLESITLK